MQIPQKNCAIMISTCHRVSIKRKNYFVNTRRMTCECCYVFPRTWLPVSILSPFGENTTLMNRN